MTPSGPALAHNLLDMQARLSSIVSIATDTIHRIDHLYMPLIFVRISRPGTGRAGGSATCRDTCSACDSPPGVHSPALPPPATRPTQPTHTAQPSTRRVPLLSMHLSLGVHVTPIPGVRCLLIACARALLT